MNLKDRLLAPTGEGDVVGVMQLQYAAREAVDRIAALEVERDAALAHIAALLGHVDGRMFALGMGDCEPADEGEVVEQARAALAQPEQGGE